MRKFKEPQLQAEYDFLLGKTPEELLELKIFGGMYHSFKAGYGGLPKPIYIPRGTADYAAYLAGKDTRNE